MWSVLPNPGAHGIWRALILRLILPDWPNEVESAKLVFDDKVRWRRPRDALRGRAHLVQNCQPKLSERPHRTNRSNEQALPGVAAVAAMEESRAPISCRRSSVAPAPARNRGTTLLHSRYCCDPWE